MISNKLFIVALGISAFIGIGMILPVQRSLPQKRNLQVLPKDISPQKLDSIMKTYNIALGVNCSFCHVPAVGMKDSLNYAADTEPMKTNARNMMRMTIELNKKYFYFDKDKKPEFLNVVTCKTCHRGEAFPVEE